MLTNTKMALSLIASNTFGTLSTHSQEVKGYPFGSVTPYCLDNEYRPIILISNIAQHTINLSENSKCSLLVQEPTEGNVQANARYSYIGDAKKISPDDADYDFISEKYFRNFPDSREYLKAHGFSFYRIIFHRARLIRGFGKIYWIESPLWDEMRSILENNEEVEILDHMNKDHQESLKKYASYYLKKSLKKNQKISMVNIDQFGFDLLIDKEKHRVLFENELEDRTQVREALISMSKKTK